MQCQNNMENKSQSVDLSKVDPIFLKNRNQSNDMPPNEEEDMESEQEEEDMDEKSIVSSELPSSVQSTTEDSYNPNTFQESLLQQLSTLTSTSTTSDSSLQALVKVLQPLFGTMHKTTSTVLNLISSITNDTDAKVRFFLCRIYGQTLSTMQSELQILWHQLRNNMVLGLSGQTQQRMSTESQTHGETSSLSKETNTSPQVTRDEQLWSVSQDGNRSQRLVKQLLTQKSLHLKQQKL